MSCEAEVMVGTVSFISFKCFLLMMLWFTLSVHDNFHKIHQLPIEFSRSSTTCSAGTTVFDSALRDWSSIGKDFHENFNSRFREPQGNNHIIQFQCE